MAAGASWARVQLLSYLFSLYIRSFTGANVARLSKAVVYLAF